jgi:endonuclease G
MKDLSIFFFCLLSIISRAQVDVKSGITITAKYKGASIAHLEIPSIKENQVIINHAGYSLVYDEGPEQAIWVAYELTSNETGKRYKRTNRFLVDYKIATGSAAHGDYSKSGYDRGDLAPAGDLAWSQSSMSESFYYSNISPQTSGFNRGIWKKLEGQVRTWAIENEAVYVVTGPILSPDLTKIGPNQVSVPKYFYKAILDYRGPDIKAIAFIMPNTTQTLGY